MFLAKRDPGLVEEMDKADCDLLKLHNTYRQFHYINQMISNWKRLYKREIHPILEQQKTTTLLDIGSGGGDITRSIEIWAQRDGFDLKITAADPDARAIRYCQDNHPQSQIEWLQMTSSDLVDKGSKFDIVISNHLIHHLTDTEIRTLLYESEKLSYRKVIFNDIERHPIGFLLFNVFSRVLFRNSFITEDGLTSIRRSFTLSELEEIIPDQWNVCRSFPFRLFLMYEK